MSNDDIRAIAVIAARATHGLNRFAANYAEAMRQIRYQDRNDTVVEQIVFAEQSSTPDQLRRFAVDQLVSATDRQRLKQYAATASATGYSMGKPAEPWWVASKVEVEIGDRINSPDSGVKMVGLRLTPIRSDLLVRSLDLDADGGPPLRA